MEILAGLSVSVIYIRAWQLAAAWIRARRGRSRAMSHLFGLMVSAIAGFVALALAFDGRLWEMVGLMVVAIISMVLDRADGNSQGIKDITRPSGGATERYESLEDWEADLETLWQGEVGPVEFGYRNRDGDAKRRKVDVKAVERDGHGNIFLKGYCYRRKELRTFNIDRITTPVKVGSRRREIDDWIVELAGDGALE